ncbi:MAG: DUF167 domain-containing protein [Candidatus Omnitrophica bacterium]|jgi:hypothetical protein|nr:DUF167 domain-containing protein [Candidatus Omnitrophota bacterium]
MKLSLRVKAGSKKEKIEETGPAELIVCVRAPAHEGKANQAVIEALSRHFSIAKSRISIIKGQASKNKIIEII